ncbi:1-acyl-sn-glycerol-3-phosphate acyltransferase [Thermaerobacter marianensis DSM 12885]|uniref:1-acyl-sn-glycerol-3-phosphate acyltransferase n=1 Tax=Thermaerobacter marianensis (strain ATCC 700841 / DSM 12885 / JCM 10246 / 7p75a) TaxID=644966 RepID=E6SKL7_THEM7|nr:lysophospholipid acyltransferase family protein [Thermaerobacter marianensis]ADU51225.1 1-acyl-sn-glycerol-3-phosphate acyltransferase [Thermaerobacter marianensis DSM 12885]
MLYRVGKVLFQLLFALGYRWDVRGVENVPAGGPLLVIANHFSWLDPPLVGTVLPRNVHFMAKQELFRNPLAAWVLRRLGAFPVRRGQPDRWALRQALELLEQGRVVGLFPEGTRSRGPLRPFEPGAALLAVKSGAPVLPVAIIGPYKLGRPVRVRIGTPFRVERGGGEGSIEAVADRMRKAIAALLAEEPAPGRQGRRRIPAG